MGLAEKLGARAAVQGRSAPVKCGGLGTVDVEALPLRELELLLRGPDGNRAVFYAACREMQAAGEELRQAGKLFEPDEILQFVSNSEADAAARTVLELSGWTDENAANQPVRSADAVTETEENRLEFVQDFPAPVPGFGQVSRETETEAGEFGKPSESDRKTQPFGSFPHVRAQNVVSGEAKAEALHESKSEFREAGREALHEMKSEVFRENRRNLHETESEFREGLHEIESEPPGELHETGSEFQEAGREALHETTSELPEGLHESKSEFRETDREGLHESKSEAAEELARLLVEGLRRAKWARGG